MSDAFYSEMQEMVDETMADFEQGVVTLTRSTPADGPNAWTPGPPTETVYQLSAAVKGVSAKYIDGVTVVAKDLQISCAVPEVEPQMTDVYQIDGKAHVPKRILRIPAAGTAAAFVIIVEA